MFNLNLSITSSFNSWTLIDRATLSGLIVSLNLHVIRQDSGCGSDIGFEDIGTVGCKGAGGVGGTSEL